MVKVKKPSVLRFLLNYAAIQKKRFGLVFTFAAIASLCEIAAPFLIGKAVDKIVGIGQVNFSLVLKYIIILAILYLLFSISTYFAHRNSHIATQKIVKQLRADSFEHLMKLPLNYYDSNSHGDIISRFVNDSTAISDGLIEGIINLFTGVVTIIGTLLIMFYLNATVAGVVILVTSITFIVAHLITKYSNIYFKNQQAITGELGGLTEEMVSGIATVKTFSYEETATRRFEEINNRLYTAGQSANYAGALTNPATRFVNYLAYISVGVVGAAIAGLSAGQISSFIIYSNQFARPFNQLTAIVTQIMAAWAAAGRVFELNNEKPEIPDAERVLSIDIKGSVEFENVYFSYNPNKSLIENLSLTAKPGQRIAIVGPTGAGKTTLVNLLLRFYDVDKGAVLVDGTDIRSITRESLRQNIGMVLQDSWLFDGTIRENIAYGRPDAADDEILAASKSAHAHSFIKRLPEGYNTHISGGGSLSQGQMQLLTIARAMLLDPNILVLDEATSSIDTLTEQRITKAFRNLMRGKTSFIIAHRLSTIVDADLIVVMNEGNVVEQGTHAELLDKQGLYAKLYSSQFSVN